MCPTIPAKKAKNINISLVGKVSPPNSEISPLHAMISDMDKIQNPNSNLFYVRSHSIKKVVMEKRDVKKNYCHLIA